MHYPNRAIIVPILSQSTVPVLILPTLVFTETDMTAAENVEYL